MKLEFNEEAARHRVGNEPEKDAVRVNDVRHEGAMLPGCVAVRAKGLFMNEFNTMNDE
jgi:hypothetical protein